MMDQHEPQCGEQPRMMTGCFQLAEGVPHRVDHSQPCGRWASQDRVLAERCSVASTGGSDVVSAGPRSRRAVGITHRPARG
jgi:hypothetical protein